MSSEETKTKYEEYWGKVADEIKKLENPNEIESLLAGNLAETEKIDKENGFLWFQSLILKMKPIANAHVSGNILKSIIQLMLQWAFVDIDSRMNIAAQIINFLLYNFNSPLVAQTLLDSVSTIFLSHSEDGKPLDMNIFLALQSPVFSYSVSEQENADSVLEIWFFSLCATYASNIFGSDKKLALAYFKLMNHAFFQDAVFPISMDVLQGSPVSSKFRKIQEQIRSAIAAVAVQIEEQELQNESV
ncbi:hypothetical protein TVAG_260740 [Trichomonas vaginalis G3]|uniref:Uncharacterized protein n=1 Tax=Trichomonas vaginalis (strain ATCC PRA-98 / G3) TaxID=412133 RepID=A2EXJ7_TRIV3|nr:hypothetical protein TVAGG3_0241270 [Trichomonas vaginalis G3]EAY02614.1 hypothetical protein TVAG_260740 [Trichomonas vaginalis G3]KAI5553354.1 hypothetical protein TVAGG3_0241270 [Trichomonas vaginalis G3]|eukprot:XP_001314837.1 hypothetical protein [Trichomonas vaginalis G3]